MKRHLLLMFLAMMVGIGFADSINLKDGWSVLAVKAPDKADKAKCLPESGEWKPGQLRGKIPLAQGAKGGNSFEGDFNAWYKKSVDVPADWKGKSVRFEQQLNWCALVVFVNGKQAGVAHFPDGAVELSPFLKYGASNEIKIFATNRGFGTGESGILYRGRGDFNRGFGADHLWSDPALVVRTPAFIDDVYARPSWRGTQDKDGNWDGKKKLTVQVEVESVADGNAEFSVDIAHDGGGTAKTGTGSAKLKKGSNVVEIDIPWEDAQPWETVAHPKLYTCDVSMKFGGKDCDDCRGRFLFGFRDIWLDGKDFVMNGHIQRFRGFWNQGMPKNVADLHNYGYNLSYETHKHWAVFEESANAMEERSRAGICVFAGMPTIVYVPTIRQNADIQAQWGRCLKHYLRSMRNYPCIVAVSCGVNQICPERNMKPDILGQDRETNGVAQNIEFARVEARKLHPNCLYFSHADGTEADISSSNLYFNFTPLQEREEWLSQWSTNGILPWYAAEFGAPYYACWYHSRVPQMTEWLAAYYGEKAYSAEHLDMLKLSKAYAKDCLDKTHGGWVDGKDLYAHNDLAEVYSRMLVYRTNRAWRSAGQNGGLMYLTSWKWDDGNTMRDRQMQANGDIITYLGGDPAVTDRTHAYWAGADIRKNLVFIWDGMGSNDMSAEWKLLEAGSNKVVASGKESVKLTQGDIKFVPISVKAPSVSRKTAYRFEVSFNAREMDKPANATVKTDSFDLEVYPAKMPAVSAKEVALFDPSGESTKVLAALSVPFKAFDTLEAAIASNPKFLVVGRRGLGSAQGLEKAEKAIEGGLRVLVLQQDAAVWKLLGFAPEDSMARRMFNVSLPGVDDTDLAHWAGAPLEDVSFGNVMKHDTRRGPRWTHTHAISGTPLLIPQRAGFRPLVRGEFDMSYSALLRAAHGKGSATFCAFDFEGRVGEGLCPAATAVAAAMFNDFFGDKQETATASVFTDGDAAKRIAAVLGLDAQPFDGKKHDDAVLLVGKDSKLTLDAVKSALGKNAHALVVANDGVAAGVGDLGEEDTFFRVDDKNALAKEPAFDGVGASLLRFRDEVKFRPVQAKGGFKAFANGAFAASSDGKILLDQLDPFQAGDRYRDGSGKAAILDRGGWGSRPKGEKDLFLRNASQSEDNFMRRYALILGNWGVGAGAKAFARSLYTKPATAYDPIAQYNVLGPWPAARDDDHLMVDPIFDVDESKGGTSGAEAEAMAIRGDVQPNPRFYPKNLQYLPETPRDLHFIDWRPVVKSRDDGFVDYSTAHPLIAAQAFCTCYCVGFLPRQTDGKITIRFGVDWRGKIWVNGKQLEPVYGGHKDEGSKIYEDVQVWGMPPAGTDLKKFDKEHGTFDGKNVISVKAGCGMSAKTFWLNVTHERLPGEIERTHVPELDGTDLYESANTRFDPYEYVYW